MVSFACHPAPVLFPSPLLLLVAAKYDHGSLPDDRSDDVACICLGEFRHGKGHERQDRGAGLVGRGGSPTEQCRGVKAGWLADQSVGSHHCGLPRSPDRAT